MPFVSARGEQLKRILGREFPRLCLKCALCWSKYLGKCKFTFKDDAVRGQKMKIILIYPDLGEESEKCLIEWLKEKIEDKSPLNISPLRYVDKLEVER